MVEEGKLIEELRDTLSGDDGKENPEGFIPLTEADVAAALSGEEATAEEIAQIMDSVNSQAKEQGVSAHGILLEMIRDASQSDE